jgi:N-sulfoglucosamine sulfohydrolase
MNWIATCVALVCLGLTATAGQAAPRNVVLIISDDQGRELGAYGSKDVRTPNLDALAADGTLFTHAFATVSSCSPSRSVIFSGLYSHSNGMYGLAHDVHNQHLLPTVRTLPQLLKEAGYKTALVGKKHILPPEALPFDAELAPEQPGNRDVSYMIDEARRFIQASAENPFLLVIGFSDPHRAAENFGNTRTWPKVSRERYNAAQLTLPGYLPDTPEVRRDLAQYYEAVSRLDSGVGLLVAALRASGHLDDTLIIFMSDNGAAFPGAKTTLYDAGIRLPLIVRAPDQSKHGVRNQAMVSWIDILPTILEWTGTRANPGYALPGRSLVPMLAQADDNSRNAIFASHSFHEINQYYPMRAVRTRQYKYIANLAFQLPYPIAGDIASSPSWQVISSKPALGLGKRTLQHFVQRPNEELYDLSSDPDEIHNLASDPRHREALEQLRRQLDEHRRATRDPWLGQASVFDHH